MPNSKLKNCSPQTNGWRHGDHVNFFYTVSNWGSFFYNGCHSIVSMKHSKWWLIRLNKMETINVKLSMNSYREGLLQLKSIQTSNQIRHRVSSLLMWHFMHAKTLQECTVFTKLNLAYAHLHLHKLFVEAWPHPVSAGLTDSLLLCLSKEVVQYRLEGFTTWTLNRGRNKVREKDRQRDGEREWQTQKQETRKEREGERGGRALSVCMVVVEWV